MRLHATCILRRSGQAAWPTREAFEDDAVFAELPGGALSAPGCSPLSLPDYLWGTSIAAPSVSQFGHRRCVQCGAVCGSHGAQNAARGRRRAGAHAGPFAG